MFRRSHLAITASAVLLAVVVACGGGSAVPTATTATSEPPPIQAQPPAATTTPPPSSAPSPTSEPSPTQTQPPTATIAPPSSSVPSPTSEPDGDDTPGSQVSLGPLAEDLTTPEVVKILTPSVVQITTQSLAMGLFNQPVPSSGVGTGIILDDKGHILTNNHVIAGAQIITVTLSNGESISAEVVGSDFQTDLAVIRVGPVDLPPARLGNSFELQVGEDVIAVGHALGLPGGPTVSKGVVSALGRSIETSNQNTIVDLIQTDASINPGNSGGPLANDRAEVIGINTAIIQTGRGIGFAINIDDAKIVVHQLIEKGFVERGFLGVTPLNLTPGLAARPDVNVPVDEGILLARVILGTAAAEAGLRERDVIIQLGGQSIANTGELSKFLIAHQPGETVSLVYFRGQTMITTEITLRGRPQP